MESYVQDAYYHYSGHVQYIGRTAFLAHIELKSYLNPWSTIITSYEEENKSQGHTYVKRKILVVIMDAVDDR